MIVEDRSIMLLVDSEYSFRSDELQTWYESSDPFAERGPRDRFNTNQQHFTRRKLTTRRQGGVMTSAAVLTMIVGACSDDPQAPQKTQPPAATDFAFVTTTDYQTGSASVIWLDSKYATEKDVVPLHSDAVARFFDGYIYVINRYLGDNIQILDPANGYTTVRQFTVGNGTDPHDILVV